MTVQAYRTEWHYDVTFNKHAYDVVRSVGRYSDWKPRWTVHGVGGTARRWCDPEKPTHKRVVAYVQSITTWAD